jgi:large subunit ribosomal protein L15
MKLNELAPKEGSVSKRTRVGRGIGSGKGKTCGRGHKGQKSRSGVAIKGFEGGQMPLYRRMPKRGFNNPFGKKIVTISPGRIQAAIDKKLLDPKKTITEDVLVSSKIVRRRKDGIKLVAGGELKTKIDLQVSGGATPGAKAVVEKAGGKVEVVEYKESKKSEPKAKTETKKTSKSSKAKK